MHLLRVNLGDVRLLLLSENVVEGQETKRSQFVGKAQQIQLKDKAIRSCVQVDENKLVNNNATSKTRI